MRIFNCSRVSSSDFRFHDDTKGRVAFSRLTNDSFRYALSDGPDWTAISFYLVRRPQESNGEVIGFRRIEHEVVRRSDSKID
jgi:hypothetical protein